MKNVVEHPYYNVILYIKLQLSDVYQDVHISIYPLRVLTLSDYLRQGGYVFTCICLFACLAVN